MCPTAPSSSGGLGQLDFASISSLQNSTLFNGALSWAPVTGIGHYSTSLTGVQVVGSTTDNATSYQDTSNAGADIIFDSGTGGLGFLPQYARVAILSGLRAFVVQRGLQVSYWDIAVESPGFYQLSALGSIAAV